MRQKSNIKIGRRMRNIQQESTYMGLQQLREILEKEREV